MKTETSYRVLVVPPVLMDLLRVIVAVFHTDAAGNVRMDARLISGLNRRDESGQGSFRSTGYPVYIPPIWGQRWRCGRCAQQRCGRPSVTNREPRSRRVVVH